MPKYRVKFDVEAKDAKAAMSIIEDAMRDAAWWANPEAELIDDETAEKVHQYTYEVQE
jgi:hypothetical protein